MDEAEKQREAIRRVQARRISTADTDVGSVDEEVNVMCEVPLTIDVEGVDHFTVLCTPVERRPMAVGFLFSEGIIESIADVAMVSTCKDDTNTIRVKLTDGVTRIGDPGRNLVITSACGACGTDEMKTKLEALPGVTETLQVRAGLLLAVSDAFRQTQPLFETCGGTHAAAIFDDGGTIIASSEDAGRHNALDKAIGKCLIAGLPTAGRGAMLSSRVSLEMVGKCARAGIELIAAISAPTSLAIEVAQRCGITLCAFVRESRATIFTHPGRIEGMK